MSTEAWLWFSNVVLALTALACALGWRDARKHCLKLGHRHGSAWKQGR